MDFKRTRHYPPSLFLINARSVLPKFDELCTTISAFMPDVVFVTESWLSNNINDNLLVIPRYNLLRSDRVGRRGGGVCAWFHDNLRACLMVSSCPHPSCFESLFVKFASGSSRYMFCLLYVPPGLGRNDHDEIANFVTYALDEALSMDSDIKICIAGDINNLPTSFLREQFALIEKVHSPTRDNAILDQIFMDRDTSELYEVSAEVGPPLKTSDHRSVLLRPLTSSVRENICKNVATVWDFRQSFLTEFLLHLSQADFLAANDVASVDDMVTCFYELFHSCASTIPHQDVTLTKKDKPWMTPLLKLMIQKRWCAYRSKNWPLFTHLKQKVQQEIIKAKRLWAWKQKRTTKGLWNVVNEMSGKSIKDSLEALIEGYPSTTVFLQELSSAFEGNFNKGEDAELLPIQDAPWNFRISSQDVFNALKKLKSNKSSGSDSIPTRLLIIGAPYICQPLAAIFNKSIQSKTYPKVFKSAYITPIPKKKSPNLNDLRPISILPAISKVLERLVLNGMKRELLTCYSPHQHAYRPLGSTTSALVEMQNAISVINDSRENVGTRVLCLDLSKAFDSLSHVRLLNLLSDKGLNHGFLTWLKSYLISRTLRVKVRGNLGPEVTIPSGVPQGSILGPFLFAAFMGQIEFPQFPNVCCVQYADDVTLIEPITEQNYEMLPFDYVSKKFSDAGLILNKLKCNVMFVKRAAAPIMNYDPLPVVSSIKTLGITLSSNLSWSEHVSTLLTRASQRLYIIRRLKEILSKEEIITVYHALITSLFLYASPVYGRLSETLLKRFEKFQRRAHRLICGTHCSCTSFPSISDKFNAAGLRFLLSCESHSNHPLNHLVPPRLPRTGFFRLPVSRTSRRLHSFFPYFCALNNQLSSVS